MNECKPLDLGHAVVLIAANTRTDDESVTDNNVARASRVATAARAKLGVPFNKIVLAGRGFVHVSARPFDHVSAHPVPFSSLAPTQPTTSYNQFVVNSSVPRGLSRPQYWRPDTGAPPM